MAKHASQSGEPIPEHCQRRWHLRRTPEPVAAFLGYNRLYFRLAAHIQEAGGTLVFRVNSVPAEEGSTTIKTLGDLAPWPCVSCSRLIGP